MINLFEYQNKETIDDFEEVEIFLDSIWKDREKSVYFTKEPEERIESQRFLQFLHKSREVKSNKYVGVIHYNKQTINLLPKIFYVPGKEYYDDEVKDINEQLLWWLSYCEKIKFPNYQTSLDSSSNDFFEVIIYLFSKYTRKLLSNSLYQQYEEVTKEESYIKGRLNINNYINQNLLNARWHKVNCTYDSFVMDNQFNRIIKYVTLLLFNITKNKDSKKNLREILFILDDVSDIRPTKEECKNIQFNPLFSDFEVVRDYCYLFLSNSISFNYKNELKLFAFLLPMETLFEEFIAGFIKQEIPEIEVQAQVTSKYMDVGRKYNLRPDLVLSTVNSEFIADTKYKMGDIKHSDLYQMMTYAVRFGIDEIILLYPNTVRSYREDAEVIEVEDEFAVDKTVHIKAYQLPVVNSNKEMLANRIKAIFGIIYGK